MFVMNRSNIVCVRTKDSYGVVDITNGNFMCFTCKRHCCHVKHLENGQKSNRLPDWLLDLLSSNADETASSSGDPLSNEFDQPPCYNSPLSFELSDPIKRIFRNGIASSFTFSGDPQRLMIYPSSRFTWPIKCEKCGDDFASGDPVENGWSFSCNGLLVERHHLYKCMGMFKLFKGVLQHENKLISY